MDTTTITMTTITQVSAGPRTDHPLTLQEGMAIYDSGNTLSNRFVAFLFLRLSTYVIDGLKVLQYDELTVLQRMPIWTAKC
jgi:hypothetical protein